MVLVNTCVSVCSLMKGEFDDLHKWPFRGDVTVQLKKTDPPHYQKIINDTPIKHVRKQTKARSDGG